jgi:hypothetical protein
MTAGISVTFCSRGRPGSLEESVTTLLDHAEDYENVEILVAMDPDDPCREQATCNVTELPNVQVFTAPHRWGYQGLHEYLNWLSPKATGIWQMWWNDDARMKTHGWDTAVLGHPREAILWPQANHVLHANLFPIWPRRWTAHTGQVTPTMHMDTWLQYVGESLARHDRIPVEVFHDRADVTGNHDDATYAEGRKPMGPEGMAPDFQEILQMQFPAYVAKISELL